MTSRHPQPSHFIYPRYARRNRLTHSKKIVAADIMFIIRQLNTLLTSGMTPVRSLDIIISAQKNQSILKLVNQIKQDLLAGKPMHTAFARHAETFPFFMTQLIRIGEETGLLTQTLTQLVRHLEQQHRFGQRISRALFYPMVTIIIASVITLSMLIFIIPRFADLFSSSGTALPLWTKCLLQLSTVIIQYGIKMIIGMISALILALYLMPQLKQKSYWFNILGKLPLIRSFYQRVLLIRFIYQLHLTYSAGIGITQSVKLATPSHPTFSTVLQEIQQEIQKGKPLHDAMQRHAIFPLFSVQMIRVGEETGQLDQMLKHVVTHLQEEFEQSLTKLSQLVEPLIMVILGVVIGGLVIGMYLPIFKLGSAL